MISEGLFSLLPETLHRRARATMEYFAKVNFATTFFFVLYALAHLSRPSKSILRFFLQKSNNRLSNQEYINTEMFDSSRTVRNNLLQAFECSITKTNSTFRRTTIVDSKPRYNFNKNQSVQMSTVPTVEPQSRPVLLYYTAQIAKYVSLTSSKPPLISSPIHKSNFSRV